MAQAIRAVPGFCDFAIDYMGHEQRAGCKALTNRRLWKRITPTLVGTTIGEAGRDTISVHHLLFDCIVQVGIHATGPHDSRLRLVRTLDDDTSVKMIDTVRS